MTSVELFSKRQKEAVDNYENLVILEKVYFDACIDFGYLSTDMINSIKETQKKKGELKLKAFKSIAEFDREYELTAEYLELKTCKYLINAYDKLLSGLKIRILSLQAENKGTY